MSQVRVMVTGDGGFVGKVLRERVSLRYGSEVVLIPFWDARKQERCDLRDPDSIVRTVEAAQPDAVIHLAGIASPRLARKEPDLAWDVNVNGTRRLATALQTVVPKARLIFAGSSEAYGLTFNTSVAPIRENSPLQPNTPYGATKAAAEVALRQMACDGLDVVCFRPFNHTAPGQSTDYVVAAFASQIARVVAGLQEPLVYTGNLDVKRDFLDARDVADIYIKAALGRGGQAGHVYNISTGTPISIGSLLEQLIEISGMKITVRTDPDRYVYPDIPIASGDPSWLQQGFECKFEYSISDTLKSMLIHFENCNRSEQDSV